MRDFIGGLVMLAGCIFAVYFGVITLFGGGMFQIVHATRAEILINSEIWWGIAKMLFSGFSMLGISYFSLILGLLIAGKSLDDFKNE
jgi:uncharacterized membrane protein YeiH